MFIDAYHRYLYLNSTTKKSHNKSALREFKKKRPWRRDHFLDAETDNFSINIRLNDPNIHEDLRQRIIGYIDQY